jgi:hypothetical protein
MRICVVTCKTIGYLSDRANSIIIEQCVWQSGGGHASACERPLSLTLQGQCGRTLQFSTPPTNTPTTTLITAHERTLGMFRAECVGCDDGGTIGSAPKIPYLPISKTQRIFSPSDIQDSKYLFTLDLELRLLLSDVCL